jgi:acylphosphatase
MVRVTLQVTGQVQGVNFRSSTKTEADALGLTGWVRNRPDGSVEVVMEGPRATVQQLVDWCQRGPVWARVEGLTTEWQAASGEFSEFEVRR